MRYQVPQDLQNEWKDFVLWLQSNNRYKFSPATVIDTERRVRRLANYLDLKNQHDESYYSMYFYRELTRGRGKQAINSDIKALNRWFLYRGWNIKLKEYHVRSDTIPHIPTKDQAHRILSARWSNPALTARNRLILAYLFLGLRVSEVVSLNMEDVNEAGIHIRNTKAGASRQIPIPPKLWERTQEYIKLYRIASDDKALFTGPKGRLTTQTVRRIAKEAGRQAGVEWFHPHAARHYAAVRLLEEGLQEVYIQIYLGHADLRTTHRYLMGLRAHGAVESTFRKINVLKGVI